MYNNNKGSKDPFLVLKQMQIVTNAEGHIAKHKANVEVYFHNAAGVGEHPDILEAIEKELNIISMYHDQIEMLKTYF